MKKQLSVISLILLSLLFLKSPVQSVSEQNAVQTATSNATPKESHLGLHVDIPKEMRMYNKTGSQCVFNCAETLGNYHKCEGTKGLCDVHLGKCTPYLLATVLTQRKVNYKFSYNKDFNFIEEWVTKKRYGVAVDIHYFDVRGQYIKHMITLVHFDRGKEVKIIDNVDKELRVQTWNWDKFISLFGGWSFVILPDD